MPKNTNSKSSLKKSSKYKLPKGYLSWSQLDLVERNEMEYVDGYIKGMGRFESEAMMVGQRFAQAMETGDMGDEDDAFKFLVGVAVPKLEVSEMEIGAVVNDIPLVGKPDTAMGNLTAFREYKTGRLEWNQTRVNRHGQLVFYALIMFMHTGKMPDAHLDWIKTEYDEYGALRVTGDIDSFHRKPFDLLELSAMTKRIENAAKKITGLVELFKK